MALRTWRRSGGLCDSLTEGLAEETEMRKHTFYSVDVFAEEKYAGNQLAVFRDAEPSLTPKCNALPGK